MSRVAPAGFARSDSGPSQREGASIGSVKRMADDVFRQYWAEALRTLAKIADDPTVPWHEREHVRRALLTRIKGLEADRRLPADARRDIENIKQRFLRP